MLQAQNHCRGLRIDRADGRDRTSAKDKAGGSMDTMPPPSAGVPALMQQLKNGDISKMQLFQQIAKLQAQKAVSLDAAQRTAESVSTPQPAFANAASIFPLGAGGAASTATVAGTNLPPPPPMISTAQDIMNSTIPNAAAANVSLHVPPPPLLGNAGVNIVQGNVEFLATGVSHDQVPRFSVQEWMASKSRASSAVSTATSQHGQTQQRNSQQTQPMSAAQNLFGGTSNYGDPAQGYHELLAPTRTNDLDTSSGSPYVYTPQRYDIQLGDEKQGFIDFTEHFRDDLERSHEGNGRSTAGLRSKGNGNNASASGGKNTSEEDKFHARVTRWKSQKEAIREQMKQQLLQTELSECTFAPKVNPKSTKVVAKLRGRQSGIGEYVRNSPHEVSERLYQEADNYKSREELAAKLKADEEAELSRECTFKPKINRASSLTEKVKAKYLDPPTDTSPSLAAATMEATAKELQECTFQPKVNPISTEMVSAQLYLQQDIYERLSRPCCITTETGSRPELRRSRSLFGDDDGTDDDDSLNSIASPLSRGTQDDFYIRNNGKGGRRRHSSRRNEKIIQGKERPKSAGGLQTDEEKEDRAEKFANFLERQKFHEQARVKRIEQTKQQLTPGYKPNINKNSLQMMENGRKGDFLERITKYALRKEHDNVKGKTVRVADPHCTFKPSINQVSAKRKARSVTELSRGDLLRRETTQRLMKLKMEQEEMSSLTFRPRLNRVSEQHEGRLKILSSPDTYLQRIQQQGQAHTIKQRRALQEKELQEFAECTFKPRTIEAPVYVQRIARSMSLTKALKQQRQATTKANEKPEWK